MHHHQSCSRPTRTHTAAVVMLSSASTADRSSSAEAAALTRGVVSPLKDSWKVPDMADDAIVVTRCLIHEVRVWDRLIG